MSIRSDTIRQEKDSFVFQRSGLLSFSVSGPVPLLQSLANYHHDLDLPAGQR